ncbi:MAG: acyl-phosphate glycerol 3-phosphate acyltransferase [Bacteroidetes bacterium]|nr:MAG: acyl-phosphate glycerol 3-phosphate acyltransferase [Bacteroidota bacterium]
MALLILLVVLAYLLGSIPSAVWVGRWLRGIDLREHGSKNAGATNTIRVLGTPIGLLVLAMDMAKGFFAVRLWHFGATAFDSTNGLYTYMLLLGIMAVVGHIYPIFAGFRGGKGVATICGVILSLQPLVFLCLLVLFVIIVGTTRYISLGSMVCGVCYPFILYFLFDVRALPFLIFAACAGLLLLYTHRKNIGRLLNGTESKFRPTKHGSLGRDPQAG